MQRRLLISTLAVAVVAVLLLGLPLAFVLSRLQVSEASDQLSRDASTLAKGLQARVSAGLPAGAAQMGRSLSDRYVLIRQDDGPLTRVGVKPPRRHTITASAATSDFSVTVETDDSFVASKVWGALLLIGSLALLAVAAAVILALLQARRLARPMEELARAADRLGSGDARPLGRRYGVQELDRVAEGLDGSAQRITDLLSAERDFAVDASHQLRTPLTALSMRLEEMIAAADDPDVVREEGSAALTQAERLADVVTQLLSPARRATAASAELTGIDEIVQQQVVEWEPAFRRAKRKLVVIGARGLQAHVTPGGLAQVLATLLDNALMHGGGTVTIQTSQSARSVVIEVRDEGNGVPPDLVSRIFERSVSGRPEGTGLGLALARTMAAADGGRVVLVKAKPATFGVFLPRHPLRPGTQPVRGPA